MDENNTPINEDIPQGGDGGQMRRREPKKISIAACICVTLLCCIVTFMITYIVLAGKYAGAFRAYADAVSGGDFNTALAAKLASLDSVIREEYLYDIDDQTLADSAMQGYMDGLGDRYADYYSADEFAALVDDTNGDMQGIGISIVNDADTHALQIIAVFPDSPALEAGLKPGDRIAYVKVEGEYVSVAELGYQSAVSALQGKADTFAEFIAYSEGSFDDPKEYSIKRGFVKERTVEGHLYALDGTVGIIRITSFDKATPAQFKETLDKLVSDGAEKLIFDVRFNPGGDLDAVCEVLDMLLPEGPVVRTVDKNGDEKTVYNSDAEEIDMPMAVLANGSTASAGELFCAALRDYDKAPIVGTNTFGKGSMQTIRSFADGSGFKFTYRYYCPPVSDNYDGVGIAPDVESELSEEAAGKNFYTLSDEEDSQLTAAYTALNK